MRGEGRMRDRGVGERDRGVREKARKETPRGGSMERGSRREEGRTTPVSEAVDTVLVLQWTEWV